MSYNWEGLFDKSPSWKSIDSYLDFDDYWQNIENEFKCNKLEDMCNTKFFLRPVIIDNQECFSTKSRKFIVHLDPTHEILQVYDSNELIYDIPEANSLILEREELNKNIKEARDELIVLEKKKYDLSKDSWLDPKIEELHITAIQELSLNKKCIKKWTDRVINIEKELTNSFADFISKNDYI
jgi:hypothetical protein